MVVGEGDTLTPPDAGAGMADTIPGARLAVIPGAGHLPSGGTARGDHRQPARIPDFVGVKPSACGALYPVAAGPSGLRSNHMVLPNSGSGIAAKQYGPGLLLLGLGWS